MNGIINVSEQIANAIVAREGGEKIENLVKCEGIAYTGGILGQYFGNVVVDLTGLKIAAQVPLLYDHINAPLYRLGSVTAAKSETEITVSGGIDADNECAAKLVEMGKKIPWQLSIGASIRRLGRIDEGEKVQINGREIEGPIYVAKESVLREVSIVAVGADEETSLRIAACFNQSKTQEVQMDKNKDAAVSNNTANVEDAVKAAREGELNRISQINAVCGEYTDLASEAIKAGYSVEEVKRTVTALKAQAAKFAEKNVNINVPAKPEINAKTIEAGICATLGISGKFDDKTLEAAESIRGISIKGAAELACKVEGKNVPVVFGEDTIRAALSTVTLPGILSNVVNKALLQGFTAQNLVAPRVCRAGDIENYKKAYRYSLADAGALEEVPEGSPIPHGTLAEEKAENQVKRYGKQLVLSHQMIVNDDLGSFATLATAMGATAARQLDIVFFETLLANAKFTDGKALFHAAHKNYLTGATSALGLDSLKKAKGAFLKQTDAAGKPINVAPKFLLVPADLACFAEELVYSPAVVGGSAVTPQFNAVSRFGLEVLSSPYLDSTAFAGNSAVAWYLFADPMIADTFEIGYLRGNRTPIVQRDDNADFNYFDVRYRVAFDFGIAPMGFRGILKAKGEN